MEQYLDFVQRVLESENTYSTMKDSSTNFNLYAYIRLSLERFSEVMVLEEDYYLR